MQRFEDGMKSCLDKIDSAMYEIEAEINSVENLSEKTLRELLTKSQLEKFKQFIGVMFRSSQNMNDHFNEMHGLCLELIYSAGGRPPKDTHKYKEKIEEILSELRAVRKLELTYAERLPFSFGEGWKPGKEISKARQLVNIPGYLLMAPALKYSREVQAAYHKSLSELDEFIKTIEQNIDQQGGIYKWASREDIKKAVKDLKVFARIARQVHRRYRRFMGHASKKIRQLEYVKDVMIYKTPEQLRKIGSDAIGA